MSAELGTYLFMELFLSLQKRFLGNRDVDRTINE